MKKIILSILLPLAVLASVFFKPAPVSTVATPKYANVSEVVEDETEKTFTEKVNSFTEQFITPVIALLGTLNVGTITTFIVWFANRKKKDSKSEAENRATRAELIETRKELKETQKIVRDLSQHLMVSTNRIEIYGENIKKQVNRSIACYEKVNSGIKTVSDVVHLILKVNEYVIANTKEYVNNGVASSVIKTVNKDK